MREAEGKEERGRGKGREVEGKDERGRRKGRER